MLTARMDRESQQYFDRLRERHFPPGRNYLAAHLTLFHALPGAQAKRIHSDMAELVREQTAMMGLAAGLRFLGRGVAFLVECPQLMTLRAALARSWHEFLTPQDRQTWHPHITVQNKVEPEKARSLLDELQREFEPKPMVFEGLDLWYYDGGPWSLAQAYAWGG